MQTEQLQKYDKQQSQTIIPEQYDFSISCPSEYLQNMNRFTHPSILNKSSMHSVNLSHQNHSLLPPIALNTQKLNLSHNNIVQFPMHLKNLKEINLSYNLVERIPIDINNLHSLRILRLSNNMITTLPFLQYIRHLELNNNPIRLITSQLSKTQLQFISLDWIPFLVDSTFKGSDRDVVLLLCQLIEKCEIDADSPFIEFHQLYLQRKTYHSLAYSLHKAIMKKYDFFIEYLKDYHSDINYNELIFLDRPILEQVLEEEYDQALELFKLRKSNLNKKSVYLMNLILACESGNLNFFKYIVGFGLKRSIIVENQEKILESIFKHFDPANSTPTILRKIMKYTNYSEDNKKVYKLPEEYSINEALCISECIMFILKDELLDKLFDFSEAVTANVKQPLLHFAVLNRNPQMVQILLKKYKEPFVRDVEGKLARTIRGSIINRKIIWKYEKNYINSLIATEEMSPEWGQNEMNKNWLKIITSPQKTNFKQQHSLIGHKLLKIQKAILSRSKISKLTNSNSLRNEGLFKEEQAHFNKISMSESGIQFDYLINYHRNIADQIEVDEGKFNELCLFELFQNSEMGTVEHDYAKKMEKMKIESGFFSPLGLCQDVRNIEEDREFIVLKGNRRKAIEDQNILRASTNLMF